MKTELVPKKEEAVPVPDRRRHPRYRYSVPITVRRASKQNVLGISIEISESGMSALISEALEVGEQVKVEPIAGSRVAAIVRRNAGKVYGFEFSDLTSAQVQQIREICKTLRRYDPRSLNI